MRAHLDAETTRLAAIWRITRKDGAQFFFTDHDRDIVFDGDTHRADAGFARTAIRSDAGFAVDNLDLVGVFAEGGIVEDEVRAGLFDGAEIAISFVNWQDPDGHGEIRLRRGTLKPTAITLAAASFGASQMTIGNLCYDEQNDRILFFTELDSVSHLLAYSKANGVEWVVPANGDMPRQARFRKGRIYILRGSTIDVRSADDGSLISSQSGFTGTSGIVRFDSRTGALYTPTSGSGIEQWLPGRSSDDSAVLGDVVTALCERVGLTAADLDVTELTDEVHGFGIARQISVRGALEMLAAAYSFDAVESDHQLKFKKRGRSPSRVIPERDLVPVNAEREAFIETRAQEVELPLRFTVVYQDRRFARTAHGNGLTGADHGAASVEGRTMRRRSGRARRKPVG